MQNFILNYFLSVKKFKESGYTSRNAFLKVTLKYISRISPINREEWAPEAKMSSPTPEKGFVPTNILKFI